jgi:hypothetical protein
MREIDVENRKTEDGYNVDSGISKKRARGGIYCPPKLKPP